MNPWAQFTDTIRMAVRRVERVNLSGSQQDLMSGQEDSPIGTPILGRRNTSECGTPHSTHITHSPHASSHTIQIDTHTHTHKHTHAHTHMCTCIA